MKLSYPVCIYPDDSGEFTAIVPDLQGCVTCGKDITETFEMAVDAASLWVLDELQDGRKPPVSSDISKVSADEFPNGFISMIVLDMDNYAEKYGNKAIKKNCTIPAWLNDMAEKANVNFSAVLKEALESKLSI